MTFVSENVCHKIALFFLINFDWFERKMSKIVIVY